MGLTSCRRITIAGTIAHRRRGAQRPSCRLPGRYRTLHPHLWPPKNPAAATSRRRCPPPRGSPAPRGARCRGPDTGLGLSGEVADPQVDVMAFRAERMDAELGAPAGPGLEVAAVGGDRCPRATRPASRRPAGGTGRRCLSQAAGSAVRAGPRAPAAQAGRRAHSASPHHASRQHRQTVIYRPLSEGGGTRRDVTAARSTPGTQPIGRQAA